MSNDSHDRLPPELDDVAERLRSSRVRASDQVLDGAMTRAQRARADGRSSLLWASVPRMRGGMRRIALAGALGLVALTGTAAVLTTSGSGGPGVSVSEFDNAQIAQYCPDNLATLQAAVTSLGETRTLLLEILPGFENSLADLQLQAAIGDLQAQIDLCVNTP
jgi:hypothetical protein